MNKSDIKKTSMKIVNQLFDIANVPVNIRQEINDLSDKYVESVINDVLLNKISDYSKLDYILESFPDADFLVADGFDTAIIGVDENTMRLIYSVTKCLEILMNQGLSEEDAVEHFEFNVSGSYMGKRTPIWCYDNF